MAFSRASVTSRRDGSGVGGEKRPSCTFDCCPASAVNVSEATAACGGCAAISSCSSFNRNFRSLDGMAGRITRLYPRDPSSDFSTVSVASDSARAARSCHQVVNHVCAEEEKGIELLNVIVEFDVLLQLKPGPKWLKGMLSLTTGKCEPRKRTAGQVAKSALPGAIPPGRPARRIPQIANVS